MCALPHKETTQWASVGLDQQLWLCFPLLFRNHFHWHWQHLPSGRHERTDDSPRENREPLPPWWKLLHVTFALWLLEKTPNGSIDIFGPLKCHVTVDDVQEPRPLMCSKLKTVASKNILPFKKYQNQICYCFVVYLVWLTFLKNPARVAQKSAVKMQLLCVHYSWLYRSILDFEAQHRKWCNSSP